MQVALMGGSYNPPTRQHTTVASELIRLGLVDEVWFVPSANHPFKGVLAHKANMTPFEHRSNMLNIAISSLECRDKLRVCSVEQTEGLSGYTWETVETLRGMFPDIEFSWVTGTDCVDDFQKWSRMDYIFEAVRFIIYPRPGYGDDRTGTWWARLLGEGHIILSENQVLTLPYSSSAARKDPSNGMLDLLVQQYWNSIQ